MLRAVMVALCLGTVAAQQARFDNYAVYRVKPTSQGQLQDLQVLQERPDGVVFWGLAQRVGASVDVMVPPHKQPDFLEFLNKAKIENRLFIDNLQQKIDDENPKLERNELFGWTSYHNLTEIYDWLDSLNEQYPQLTTVVGGQTFEGREIRGAKVSYKKGNPAIFIEAGIHAREWIAPATATFVLNQVLTSTDPEVRAVVEDYDWYVFPSCNPDGYEYSHTTDRLWRKTRSGSGLTCRGADPNRNWGFHWLDGGSSNNTCSIFYAGASAFSEKETETLSNYITTIGEQIKVYLAFHSYSQVFLFPYGHTKEHISNYDQLMTIGKKAADKLAVRYGTNYTVGNIFESFYVASGSSLDWVSGKFGVPITFGVELRDKGEFGFILPSEQIIPTGEEIFDAIISILKDARDVSLAKNQTHMKV